MLKITKTYRDYNDVERTEDFYFNLTKAEIMEMELGITGGLSESLQRIIAAKDIPGIIKVFKDLLIRSYGVKSPDGRGFIKSPELVQSFMSTEAYSQIYMELATDDKAASDFVNGIIPASLAKEVAEMQKKNAIPGPTN